MTKKFDIQWYTFIISYCYLHGENKRIKEKLDLMFVYLRFKTYKHTPRVLFILRKFIYTFKYQCPNYQSMLHFINVLNFSWIPCWNKVICDSGKVSSICSRPVNLQNQWMIKAILGRDRTQVSVRFHSAQYGENPPTWGISGWYHWEKSPKSQILKEQTYILKLDTSRNPIQTLLMDHRGCSCGIMWKPKQSV